MNIYLNISKTVYPLKKAQQATQAVNRLCLVFPFVKYNEQLFGEKTKQKYKAWAKKKEL